jgi:hypothetical protein
MMMMMMNFTMRRLEVQRRIRSIMAVGVVLEERLARLFELVGLRCDLQRSERDFGHPKVAGALIGGSEHHCTA